MTQLNIWNVTVPRLDYCNSHLLSTLKANLHMLQLAQNTVVIIVTRTERYERIQLVLSELFWLSISQRINFKVAILIFKIRKSGKPAYQLNLIRDKGETRSIRSSNKCYLEVPKRRTETAKRSFSDVAPYNSIWQLDPATVSLCTCKSS